MLSLLAFLLVWGISLVTNTHQFYLKGSLEEIRIAELTNAKNQISGLRDNAVIPASNFIKEFETKGQSLIKGLGQQIRNEGRPGCGDKCKNQIKKLEDFLDTRISIVDASNASKLAKAQCKNVEQLLNNRLKSYEDIEEITDNYKIVRKDKPLWWLFEKM